MVGQHVAISDEVNTENLMILKFLGRGRGRSDGPPSRRADNDWDEDMERYKNEDKNKPMLQIINPTMVPKGGFYFEVNEAESRKRDFKAVD